MTEDTSKSAKSRQSRTGLTSTGVRKAAAKSNRSRAREFALQALAERGGYHALVALGCIIRGETYHFELVANESGASVSRVALDHRLPIANPILTTENLEQAIARQTDKGRDAAQVAVEMARLLASLT